jgi:hypothetical protein
VPLVLGGRPLRQQSRGVRKQPRVVRALLPHR